MCRPSGVNSGGGGPLLAVLGALVILATTAAAVAAAVTQILLAIALAAAAVAIGVGMAAAWSARRIIRTEWNPNQQTTQTTIAVATAMIAQQRGPAVITAGASPIEMASALGWPGSRPASLPEPAPARTRA